MSLSLIFTILLSTVLPSTSSSTFSICVYLLHVVFLFCSFAASSLLPSPVIQSPFSPIFLARPSPRFTLKRPSYFPELWCPETLAGAAQQKRLRGPDKKHVHMSTSFSPCCTSQWEGDCRCAGTHGNTAALQMKKHKCSVSALKSDFTKTVLSLKWQDGFFSSRVCCIFGGVKELHLISTYTLVSITRMGSVEFLFCSTSTATWVMIPRLH